MGPIGYSMPPVELKSNEFFVLGDNRNASFDSHVWGPAPKSGFIGRVEFRHHAGSGWAGSLSQWMVRTVDFAEVAWGTIPWLPVSRR